MLWYTKSRRAQNPDDYETWIEGGVMPTMNAFDNGDIRTTILVGCFELWDFPTEEVAPAMTSRRARDLIAYPIHDSATRSGGKRKLSNGEYVMDGKGNGLGIGEPGDPMNTLTSGDRHAVAIEEPIVFYGNRVADIRIQDNKVNTLQARMGTGGNNMPMVAEPKAYVRRLTPVECERLQGFPDNWTEGQSDSARYKQMGNAVAVPVVEWIIGNICDTLKTAE
jgi:site-specific DNA-cytosine methylase